MHFTDDLPTLDELGATIPNGLDVAQVASQWLSLLSGAIEAGSIEEIAKLFLENAFWRDLLVLSWDFHTLHGLDRITEFLADRLHAAKLSSFKLDGPATLQQQFPDLCWIVAIFRFTTNVGHGTGVFRLVPTASGTWKAHNIFTNLEGLTAFPERINGSRVSRAVPSVRWQNSRTEESAFEASNPTVLVIGAGHVGLAIAARLKYLDVPTLVVDRFPRIGDSWRNRYDTLCLHWPVWFDHMPYLPHPPTWPRYTPALKMAEWLECYAKLLELNVWTSANVTHASQHDDGKWTVDVDLGSSGGRLLSVNHIVFATGLGDGIPVVPPNLKEHGHFRGKLMHGIKYKRGSDFVSKRVVIIGTGNSAHDIAADSYNHGADVTMVQRGPTFVMDLDKNWKFMGPLYSEDGPPLAVADLLFQSIPFKLVESGLAQRAVRKIEDSDRELLDGLAEAGFKTWRGPKEAGVPYLLKVRGGGHNFNVTASRLIIDGKIKLKSVDEIQGLTHDSIEFSDGSRLPADVIICATGLGDPREYIRQVCGDKIADRCGPVAGVDAEGETPGQFRPLAVDRLWYAWAPLSQCRFYSKHIALQIKAREEDLVDKQ